MMFRARHLRRAFLLPYTMVVKCNLSHIVWAFLPVLVLPIAVWADLTDFQVNDDGTATEQSYSRVAVVGNGGFVICWTDKRSGNSDIYLQAYDSEGNPVNANFRVNDDDHGAYQAEPALTVDLSGLYSVVWKDYRNSSYPFGPEIYFQRYDTSMTAIGDNRNLTADQPDSLKETPDIALSPWGGGIVVWADYRNRNWDIYGQLISSNGILIGSNFKVNNDIGSSQQHAPRVAVSPEGWFAVTWYDNRYGNDDIFAQLYDSLAEPLGGNLRVNSDAGSIRQAFPDIATDGAGHFTVVWVDWRNGTYPANPDIYARKFTTNLIPVTGDTRINRDGTPRAQRDPCIAADRRGNVAIIWSDSTGSSWDIVGQMIDVDGVIQESNFQANANGDSAQLHPDVALDGRYRYITWTDKRNGNYDIYASVAMYNDPTLVPNPTSMKFEMETGGLLPESQQLVVDQAGYNSLDFEAHTSHDWLSVFPAIGQTPETLTVSINTDTLSLGTYFSSIALIDTENNDSSVVVSVHFDVTAPILQLSPDSLFCRAFAGIDVALQETLTVTNTGGGNMVWAAYESADWLTLVTSSGTNDGYVVFEVNATGLAAGNYVESLVIDAGDVMNSPDTAYVVLEVTDNQPYLLIEPADITLATSHPELIDTFILVTNGGTGILNWRACVSDAWLVTDQTSGLSGDTIHLSVDTSLLTVGQHSTRIDITDSAAFNIYEYLTFCLDYLGTCDDTVEIGSANTQPLQSIQVPITLRLADSVKELVLPLTYDQSIIVIDSVVAGADLPSFSTVKLDAYSGGVSVVCIGDSLSDSSLAPGSYQAAILYITSQDQPGYSSLNTPSLDSLATYMITGNGRRVEPTVLPGEVTVDYASNVNEPSVDRLPSEVCLLQNYPNPFNLSTTIAFELPSRQDVELEVFNILGQKVHTLSAAPLPVGSHVVSWDGCYSSGKAAPSGIYFYRLGAGDISRVRKMVLIK